MGCCVSSPSPSKSTDDEISAPISPTGDKSNNGTATDKPNTSEQPEMQKKHSHKKNTHPHISEHAKKENSKSYDSLNGDGTPGANDNHRDRAEFQEKMANKKIEQEQDAKRLQELQQNALDDQVTRQRTKSFLGLHQIFEIHADINKKMDIDALTAALAHFGMIIDTNRTLKKFVFSKFDIDNLKEIDYNDFSATMSHLIGTKNEEALLLMFQIFDNDEDGYLNTEDMARILLAQNQIAVVVTGQQDTHTTVTWTLQQTLKTARKMIAANESVEFKDNKISFDEYYAMMMKLDAKDMMFDHMVQPSMTVIDVDVNMVGGGTPLTHTPSYAYTPKQVSVYTPNQGDDRLLEINE